MTGRWAAVIGARLLREETYRLMAAPAIADMQFEPSARWRHYAAVWWVIGQAVLHDLQLDLSAVLGPAAPRGVWPQILGLYVLFFVVRAISRVREGIRLFTPDMPTGTFRRSLRRTSSQAVRAPPYALIATCPERRAHGQRRRVR